ncbi:ATP-binding protein/SpoIIE family protein phosphatase [Streptomyces sp. ID05-04B]|uniref:ATP-binding SpoIIE family protein phosphatase n=1 Tax=unclassified Streptomyces TaxID=2593676 RepID=UPI000D1BA089|nr:MULTISPECIES: ATP-binding SpoIIE family protein phosphatase [unclassified Streptomyces]AVV46929.1 phosphatase [Streptomyces sp. P3]MDX5565207.1 ATP-binding protein/SpoIIE family protein phosphatase [Streptomyces sp. ID05-04B]
MTRVWDVPVHDSTRVRDARVAAEDAAALAGLDGPRTADAALVATELATNLLKHARGGQLLVEAVAAPGGPSEALLVQIVAVDHGPGISDVPAALGDGFSTAGSLGAGLGTCRRLSDDFDLHSVPGRGTVALARIGGATVSFDRRGPAGASSPHSPAAVRAGGINIPFGGGECSGDAWTCVRDGDGLTLMMADGLGHGPEAARASAAAVAEARRGAHLPPAELLRRLDGALRGTRGAAVGVARLDLRAGRLRFAGIGNIGARLREGDSWRHLISRPGIVGVHRPATLPETEADWAADRLLVLHSDGLPSRWAPPADPRLLCADPALTAAVTVRDAGSSARPVRDDTAVAVLSPNPSDRS